MHTRSKYDTPKLCVRECGNHSSATMKDVAVSFTGNDAASASCYINHLSNGWAYGPVGPISEVSLFQLEMDMMLHRAATADIITGQSTDGFRYMAWYQQ